MQQKASTPLSLSHSLSLCLRTCAQYSHQHQVESSHGLSLEFNGFVLMYNLLSEAIAESRVLSSNATLSLLTITAP